MQVYKITNLTNGKVYIGQTIHPIEERFKRHIQDAESNRLNTHLARAIRKYGKENFSVEPIDQASSQEELTNKEYYWINYYDSVNCGYNETAEKLKCGGNTYKSKTKEEMQLIPEKIRKTKLGGKNPRAEKVKCKNIFSNEEYHFNSLSEMQAFFNWENHAFITRRCLGKIKSAFQGEWLIAYENNNYPSDYTISKHNYKARQVRATNTETKKYILFNSYSEAERKLQFNRGEISRRFSKGANSFILNGYLVEQIN